MASCHSSWKHTLIDLMRSVPAAHWHEMNLITVTSYLFLIASMLFLGRFETRTDDDGVVVFFILVMTFTLGCLRPKRPWCWALSAWCVPAADLIHGAPNPSTSTPSGFLLLCLFVTAVGLAGAYSGAFCGNACRTK